MSVTLMTMVFSRTFGTAALKAVALKCADHADDDGKGIWPSPASIAAECELSEPTVRRALKHFTSDEVQLLKLVKKGGKGRFDTNRYDINIEVLEQIPLHSVAHARLDARQKGKSKVITVTTLENGLGDHGDSLGDHHDSLGDHGDHQTISKPLENLSDAQAREKEDLKDDSGNGLKGDSQKQITDQFHALVKKYPSSVGDSWVKPEKDWNLLTDEQRHAALERCDEFVAVVKSLPGRNYLVAIGKYISERMWERLGEMKAKPDIPHLAKKYGKEWFAYRMWLLDRRRLPYSPPPSIAAQIKAGNGALYDDSRWRAEYPGVYHMDEAAKQRRDVGVPRNVGPLNTDDFQKVKVGSDAYNAWGLYHHDKDWPWIDPPIYIEWIWMPSEFPPAPEDSIETALDDETQAYIESTR